MKIRLVQTEPVAVERLDDDEALSNLLSDLAQQFNAVQGASSFLLRQRLNVHAWIQQPCRNKQQRSTGRLAEELELLHSILWI